MGAFDVEDQIVDAILGQKSVRTEHVLAVTFLLVDRTMYHFDCVWFERRENISVVGARKYE